MTSAPVFILGAPRSGTTILRRSLSRAAGLFIPEETNFIPQLFPAFARHWQKGQPQAALNLLQRQPVFAHRQLTLDLQTLDPRVPASQAYGHAIDALMLAAAARRSKLAWGEKTPAYIFSISRLAEWFPAARFVHVLRDGRDVALSQMPLRWGPNNAAACARLWRASVRAWQAAAVALPERCIQLRYEDFVAQPLQELQRLAAFLGLPIVPERLAELPIHPNRVAVWRKSFEFSPRELAAYQALAGAELTAAGYEIPAALPPLPFWFLPLSVLDDAGRRLTNRWLRGPVNS